ncbi:Cytochrome b-c1 complex subunit 8, mitochondrial [Elasticomyces elasticus]|nr:Cytochrome b-c1 complex subunit 8, mitochondrial [Elasticomyces elasticus]KAK3660449.1 Cytochrome b-c1 complex subunit 8, mitochondrial [Elasticomyces elasticus]KAK4912251.1 Cytochrome b-c1 complex subunit 8, mitochondrial [Elasticomyces elasticus]KAK5751815.1 Cytochrome b-c1 complex subunit 8, mitochondrial [Elasticomyces elasticus]
MGGGSSHGKDAFRLVKGEWGDPKSQPQRGIVSYTISPNRQNPLAGALRAAVFNTFRRSRGQVLYWTIPLLMAGQAMEWANRRSTYLNSKAGRAEFADA